MKKDRTQKTESVRRFNRFYTQQIGVLNEKLMKSPFTLTEARVIYELAHHKKTTASSLVTALGLDAGYLSRLLRRFENRGLLEREPSKIDGRQSILSLTEQGVKAFTKIDSRSKREIEAVLNRLEVKDQIRLIDAMHTIMRLLGAPVVNDSSYLLRLHQPGDMGWVVHRHGVLYASEYGWDERFEALVAGIVAEFIHNLDPKRERCWIAEKDNENVGSVFLVKKSDKIAKLRLLLVEPHARGIGIGARLVDESIRFAQQAGYSKITLWTQSNLLAARKIYRAANFNLMNSGKHHSFGYDLVEETWELEM